MILDSASDFRRWSEAKNLAPNERGLCRDILDRISSEDAETKFPSDEIIKKKFYGFRKSVYNKLMEKLALLPDVNESGWLLYVVDGDFWISPTLKKKKQLLKKELQAKKYSYKPVYNMQSTLSGQYKGLLPTSFDDEMYVVTHQLYLKIHETLPSNADTDYFMQMLFEDLIEMKRLERPFWKNMKDYIMLRAESYAENKKRDSVMEGIDKDSGSSGETLFDLLEEACAGHDRER